MEAKKQNIVEQRIKELVELKQTVQKEIDWHNKVLSSATESFNCGYPEIDALERQIQSINRAIKILEEVQSGNLVISEEQKMATLETIGKLEKQLTEVGIHLSDAKMAKKSLLFATELIDHGLHSDCTYDLTVCNCDCHKNPGLEIKHFIPCCTDVCPKCKRNILFGLLEAHRKCCCN